MLVNFAQLGSNGIPLDSMNYLYIYLYINLSIYKSKGVPKARLDDFTNHFHVLYTLEFGIKIANLIEANIFSKLTLNSGGKTWTKVVYKTF